MSTTTNELMTATEGAHPLHSLADPANVDNSPNGTSSSNVAVSAPMQSPASRAAASQALPDRENSMMSGMQSNKQESVIS